MTVHEAVKELRRRVQMTQQELARHLGLSITAVQNYEKQRVPIAPVLYALEQLSWSNDQQDLAAVFENALSLQLGSKVNFHDWRRLLPIEPITDLEIVLTAAVLETLRTDKLERHRDALEKVLTPAIEEIARKIKARKSYDNFVADWVSKGLAFIRGDRVVLRPPTEEERKKYGIPDRDMSK